MKFNSEKIKLKELYENLKKRSLPKFSPHDELSNWIEELIEIDAHYAGLTLSAIEGEKISKKNLCDLIKLRKSLDLIELNSKDNSKENYEIMNNCYNYLDNIQSIDFILNKIST
jgi:hypothetical protein